MVPLFAATSLKVWVEDEARGMISLIFGHLGFIHYVQFLNDKSEISRNTWYLFPKIAYKCKFLLTPIGWVVLIAPREANRITNHFGDITYEANEWNIDDYYRDDI